QLAPLSGPNKTMGEHARQGILIAVDEVNATGEKVNGRRVEVHHADDHGPPSAAGDEAVRLIAVTRATGLPGRLTSERAGQVARAAQPYGVPVVTPSPLPAPLAAETVFSTSVSPARQGEVLGRFVADELKVKHVAVIFDARSGVCTGVAGGFVKKLAAAEG